MISTQDYARDYLRISFPSRLPAAQSETHGLGLGGV